MNMAQRISRIHQNNSQRRRFDRQTVNQIRLRKTPEMSLGRGGIPEMVALEQDIKPTSVFLVARRPPLSEQRFLYRWLARWVYERIQWAPDYGIEYQGVYTDESEARHVASGPGMFVIEMPLNASLPLETCQYGSHDFPMSEASSRYRNRKFPFVAVPRKELDDRLLLEAKIEQVARAASCA